MKAVHNEAQRPCSYLQSTKGKKKKKKGGRAGGVEIDKDASAWAAFEMQIKCVI